MSFDISSMIGSQIAWHSRKVYNWLPDPSLVLKVDEHCDTGTGDFQNVMEWKTWERVGGADKVKDWFAPCVWISPCGQYLLQKRTEPITSRDKPKQVPRFLTDLKQSNFGLYEGRIVVHDYGIHLLMEKGMNMRMMKPYWWNE